MSALSKPVFSVQVRDLVEFVLRRGDLRTERDFVAPDRALSGTRGHQQIQRTRPDGYRKEVSVFHEIVTEDLILRIQGRIDGLLDAAGEVVLEEIKTVQGPWRREADPLHWAQAKIYGFIYAHDQTLQKIGLQLTYLDLETGYLTEFRETCSREDLCVFFEETSAIYVEWIRERHSWCQHRDSTIRSLQFPFLPYRPGQRELTVAAYQTLASGRRLFLEAPTGIGKTVSVLFAALKAMAKGKLERIFYLTARTIARGNAEKAFADLQAAGLGLRRLTLTAKQKICVRDGQPCDTRTCPLALGYYDRRKKAMREILSREAITRPVLEGFSQSHQVCPFQLSLDLSHWVDGIICDYNYAFDPKVYLRRHFDERAGAYGFLVDEAHNLVDRGREMFSAELQTHDLEEVGAAIQDHLPVCADAVRKLAFAVRNLAAASSLNLAPAGSKTNGELDFSPSGDAISRKAVHQERPTGQFSIQSGRDGVLTTCLFPSQLAPLLDQAIGAAETWLAKNDPADFRDTLLELYFQLHSFRRTAELYDERYRTIIEPGPTIRLTLFCLDPSHQLRLALGRARTTVLFSATLKPLNYFCLLLGGDAEDRLLQLPSPFPAKNLTVLVHKNIRTHFKARAETLEEVVEAIGGFVEGRRGNYLVYFPSYQYLTLVHERFQAVHPGVLTLLQHPRMTEMEREAFLAAFAVEHGQTLAGFAVMGGVFGEGIDLVGEQLIGAVIVGVGMPQLSARRDLIRDHFQQRAKAGMDYAYFFPGMNRVVQATGRVIRSEIDRGVVLLLDSRFSERRFWRLLPAWWHRVGVTHVDGIRESVDKFWSLPPATSPTLHSRAGGHPKGTLKGMESLSQGLRGARYS